MLSAFVLSDGAKTNQYFHDGCICRWCPIMNMLSSFQDYRRIVMTRIRSSGWPTPHVFSVFVSKKSLVYLTWPRTDVFLTSWRQERHVERRGLWDLDAERTQRTDGPHGPRDRRFRTFQEVGTLGRSVDTHPIPSLYNLVLLTKKDYMYHAWSVLPSLVTNKLNYIFGESQKWHI